MNACKTGDKYKEGVAMGTIGTRETAPRLGAPPFPMKRAQTTRFGHFFRRGPWRGVFRVF